MRRIPTSQLRPPLYPRGALAASWAAGAACFAYIAAIETHGIVRYVLITAVLVVSAGALWWAWRVSKRDTERLR
jgi:hypothetical protein